MIPIRSPSAARVIKYGIALALILGTLSFSVPPALAQPEQLEWTKVDCASSDAHLVPPPGYQGNCFEGELAHTQGQSYACRLFNYSFGFLGDGSGPHFYARVRYPNKGGKTCATLGFPNPTYAMQHVHKFVETQATNWSAAESAGADMQLMFFDAKDQKRDGRCFAFTKNGPAAGFGGKGHLFTLIGFFCGRPGQDIDIAAASGIVQAIQLKMY
ncbi:MAG TPA: hypothetical protein VMC10_07455 [Stellaceae bacterium]|nr:hypothetical protein [Stellaceae bacterium]